MTDNIVADIEAKFYSAETARQNSHEERWAKAYHNYRGKYYKDVKFSEHEKSRVFIKATKTKVLAAYGQMIDIILGQGKLPIAVSKTDIPKAEVEVSMEQDQGQQALSFPQQTNPFNVGYAGDGRATAGATFDTMSQQAAPAPTFGGGQAPTLPGMTASPEEKDFTKAARNMEKLIHDQITDSRGHIVIRDAVFEACLLGTGVVKGPFNANKVVTKYKSGADGSSMQQETVKIPKIEFVSTWNFYPDPQATCIDECDWTIQRHKLSRSQMAALAEQPQFNAAAIQECLSGDGNYIQRNFENEVQLEDNEASAEAKDRWEVLEYWGLAKAIDLPADMFPVLEDVDVSINAWVCDGQLLRLVLNPFEPSRLPYMIFPYEKNPYSIWGVGVAENMDDMQSMMNGSARMAIDNAALAGNLVFDIDENALVPGEDNTIYPGKQFTRQSGVPGQSIYGIKFPNTAHENMMMFDRWRQLADESTGIPSYSHGNTGVTGMTRTASGMSMLMGAANLNIKTAVRNADDFLFEPLGMYFFYWNKQFYEGDLDIEGDLEVKAMGTHSLIQKEVKSQRLLTFLQLAGNPQVAPMINLKNVVEDLAHTLDADAERYINDMDQARQQAEIVGLQNQMVQQQQTMAEGTTGNGGGNIGTGQAAQPGEEEFSANKGGGE